MGDILGAQCKDREGWGVGGLGDGVGVMENKEEKGCYGEIMCVVFSVCHMP